MDNKNIFARLAIFVIFVVLLLLVTGTSIFAGEYDKKYASENDSAHFAAMAGEYEYSYTTSSEDDSFINMFFKNLISIGPVIFAVIVSAITTIVILLNQKGSKTINNRTYEVNGSFNLTARYDNYVREHTSKVRIEK